MIRTLLICTLGFSAGTAGDALAQHQTLAPESRKLGPESALALSGMVSGKPIQVSGGGTPQRLRSGEALVGGVLLAVALVFVWRSFYAMRIPKK